MNPASIQSILGKTRPILLLGLCCFTSLALADSEAVKSCRQQYAEDPTAHIACLEQALDQALDRAQEVAPTAQTEAATPLQAAGGETASALGSEQVLQKQRIRGEIAEQPESVSIVAIRYDATELGVFRLASGQIWRETEVSPYHLRLKPGQSYQAVIERGTVGGYRMQVEGIRRMLKIERLK